MDKKIWKIWEFNSKIFEIKDFSNYYELINKYGYDFFYSEIFDWNFSDTKCIYEMSECKLKSDDIVVDFGSNIGLFTRYAAEKCDKVISIEGSPEIFSCLVENVSDLKNVDFLNANIISESNKQSESWTSKKTPINVTLKDIFYLYDLDHIDFLKVDIEGGEYNIFKDVNPTYIKKIRNLAIETHDKNLNDELIKHICNTGKSVYYFNWHHGAVEPQTMLYFY